MVQQTWVSKTETINLYNTLNSYGVTDPIIIDNQNNTKRIIINVNQISENLSNFILEDSLPIFKIPVSEIGAYNQYIPNIIIAQLYKEFKITVTKLYIENNNEYLVPLVKCPITEVQTPSYFWDPDVLYNNRGLQITEKDQYEPIYIEKYEQDMIINRLRLKDFIGYKLLIDNNNPVISTNPLLLLSLRKLNHTNLPIFVINKLYLLEINTSKIINTIHEEISNNLYGQTLKYMENGYVWLYKVDQYYKNIVEMVCNSLNFKLIETDDPYLWIKTLNGSNYTNNIFSREDVNRYIDMYMTNSMFQFKISGNWYYRFNINEMNRARLTYLLLLSVRQYNEISNHTLTNKLKLLENASIDIDLSVNLSVFSINELNNIMGLFEEWNYILLSKINIQDLKNLPELIESPIRITKMSISDAILWKNWLSLYYPEVDPIILYNGDYSRDDIAFVTTFESDTVPRFESLDEQNKKKLVSEWVSTFIKTNNCNSDRLNTIIQKDWYQLFFLSSSCEPLDDNELNIRFNRLAGLLLP